MKSVMRQAVFSGLNSSHQSIRASLEARFYVLFTFYSPMRKIMHVVSVVFFTAFLFGSQYVKADQNSVQIRKTFRDCKDCPEMVTIPNGIFMMGDTKPESSIKKSKQTITINVAILASQDNGPLHRVTLKRGLAVGKFSVTFDEWDFCVADGGCDGYRPDDSSWGRGRQPVTNVNWYDAQSYIRWLSIKTGKQYRLLSESEWEYAARAGTSTAYYWGEEIGSDHANCCGTQWDETRLAPVGSFESNDFGLHDMLGHVWQWTEDCWHKSYSNAPSDGTAWIAGGDCSKSTMRGGNYQSPPYIVRVASRNFADSTKRHYGIGFRVARMYP